MRTLTLSVLFIGVLVFSGCTSVQVSQDYDPHADMSRYGTWQWRDPAQTATGDIRIDNPLLHKRIRHAVDNHLTSRNISPAKGKPDLYLSYHLTIQQKTQIDTYYSTVGAGSYYQPWYGGIGTETSIRQYDECRLTIDFHSADTGALVWRGVGVFRLRTHNTPQEATEATGEIVDKILYQFPPAARPSSTVRSSFGAGAPCWQSDPSAEIGWTRGIVQVKLQIMLSLGIKRVNDLPASLAKCPGRAMPDACSA